MERPWGIPGRGFELFSRITKGDSAVCFIRSPQSGFALPENPKAPLIMVGAGTGIAPFRDLSRRGRRKMSGNSLGEAHLYFESRHPEEDDLYKDEFDHAEKNGLVTVHRAYSRLDQDCKVYVQDVLLREVAQIIALLDQGGHLYICGDGSKMAPAVENVLLQAYEKGITPIQKFPWSKLEQFAGGRKICERCLGRYVTEE